MNFIMRKQMEMKKKSKKGFTLVEVIVVIVIIAILAAIAIPALTGYIDRAGQRAAIVEARTVVTAVQTIASDSLNTTLPTSAANWVTEINKLTGGSITSAQLTGLPTFNASKALQTMTFKTSSGAVVTYNNGNYTVS